MAIQVRRGNYADLDTSKLVQGEPFVTLDKVNGNYYVGMAIGSSNVVRLASWDDLTDIKDDCEQYRDEALDSKNKAKVSEDNAKDSSYDAEAWAVGQRNGTPVQPTDATYHNNSKYYSENCDTVWGQMDNAMQRIQPTLSIDFTTGVISMTGTYFLFTINNSTGHLEWQMGV